MNLEPLAFGIAALNQTNSDGLQRKMCSFKFLFGHSCFPKARNLVSSQSLMSQRLLSSDGQHAEAGEVVKMEAR